MCASIRYTQGQSLEAVLGDQNKIMKLISKHNKRMTYEWDPSSVYWGHEKQSSDIF